VNTPSPHRRVGRIDVHTLACKPDPMLARHLLWLGLTGVLLAASGCLRDSPATAETTTGTTTGEPDPTTSGEASSSTGAPVDLDCLLPFAGPPVQRICDSIDGIERCFDRYEIASSTDAPSIFALVDINHDGWDDVLAQEHFPDRFRVLGSRPPCGLVEHTPLDPGPHALTYSFLVLDADEDGEQDILVKVQGAVLHVYGLLFRGDGSGAFTRHEALAIQPHTSSFDAAGDLDGDGHIDVVAQEGDALRIYRGDGHGGFIKQPLIALGNSINGAGVVDFNEDRILDIVISRSIPVNDFDEDYEMLVLFGDQKTGYPTTLHYPDWNTRYEYGFDDFDGDGHVDILASGTIFYGDGTGQIVRTLDAGAGSKFADIDGDGAADIVSYGVALNRGDHFVPAFPDWPSMGDVQLGDLNGDGHVDVVGQTNEWEPVDKFTIIVLLAVPG
jgi:hypothetical protein